jgi:hypothetical protein
MHGRHNIQHCHEIVVVVGEEIDQLHLVGELCGEQLQQSGEQVRL